MRVLVTGSSGYLGSTLCARLKELGHEVTGIDVLPSIDLNWKYENIKLDKKSLGSHTTDVGSITDRALVERLMKGIDIVYHTAALHKPDIERESRQLFIDVNITGTLVLLEAAVKAKVKAFIYTSTTSIMINQEMKDDGRCYWIAEDIPCVPRNIYGVSKQAAENLCRLFHDLYKLPTIILRVSRFFPEVDDNIHNMDIVDTNNRINEYLYRRASVEDMAEAHICATKKVFELKFGIFLISAPTPFKPADVEELSHSAPKVLERYFPEYKKLYEERGWSMLKGIDRVYDSSKAQAVLGWRAQHDFAYQLQQLKASSASASSSAPAAPAAPPAAPPAPAPPAAASSASSASSASPPTASRKRKQLDCADES